MDSDHHHHNNRDATKPAPAFCRRWAFRLALLLLFTFAGGEIFLRATSSISAEEKPQTKDIPAEIVRTLHAIPKQKTASTKRVFLLGGAWIAPNRTASFPSLGKFLARYLPADSAEVKYEIFDLSYPALNGAQVVEILRAVASLKPDLLFLHPGGIEPPLVELGAAPDMQRPNADYRPLPSVSDYSFLARLFVRGTIDGERILWGSSVDRPDAFNQKTVNAIVKRKRRVLRSFELMLDRVHRIAGEHHVPLLSTGGEGSLASRPPAASIHHERLTPTQLAQFAVHFRKAKSLCASGDFPAAWPELEASYKISPTYSANAFLLGKARLLVTHDSAGAEQAFVRAHDYDAAPNAKTALPYGTIAGWARANKVAFLDFDAFAKRVSGTGLLGEEFFAFDTGFTERGLSLLAEAIAVWMKTRGFQNVRVTVSDTENPLAASTATPPPPPPPKAATPPPAPANPGSGGP